MERMFCTDEIGRFINPLLVEGQLLGGIAQGGWVKHSWSS